MRTLFCHGTTRGTVLETNDKEASRVCQRAGIFQIEDASARAPGVFGRAESHPGDDRSQTLGRVPPRFIARSRRCSHYSTR